MHSAHVTGPKEGRLKSLCHTEYLAWQNQYLLVCVRKEIVIYSYVIYFDRAGYMAKKQTKIQANNKENTGNCFSVKTAHC